MDDGRHRENGRHRVDYYKGVPSQWNMPQYQVKDPNAMMMNKKILQIVTERNTAIEERDRALSEKKAALVELDMAIQQRDAAIADRNDAIRERDNSIAALRFQESTMNMYVQRGSKRNQHHATQPSYMRDPHVTEAFPITAVEPVQKSRITKETKARGGTSSARSKKRKKVREDLNQNVTTDGSKAEWDAQELGLMDRISFDETTMPIPIPICSCTGVARQCYKWGSGGWQSSCCTTTLSVYPLPQMPNKRHSRMGGRKMSGSVFTRLISRLASQGHDMSSPVDLKTYWAKHGTNRYITIK